uniref:Transcobalamin-1-like protein n=1 Tax=Callorhinchus milii TaxID=7868 RepID=V9KXL4_CALMI
MVRSVAGNDSDPNPSVLIALRLSDRHNLAAEAELREGVKRVALEKASGGEEPLSSGLLALYIMSLSASCLDPSNLTDESSSRVDLFETLREKVAEEIKSIDALGRPKTNYYQFGLDLLAFCANEVHVPSAAVDRLTGAALRDNFTHGGRFSVDTASIAALALACLKKRDCENFSAEAETALEKLVAQILSHVRVDGTIGNLYSTGQAIEALRANQDLVPAGAWDCERSLRKVLEEIPKGSFDRPQAAAQVVPSLEGQTLLNVNHLKCSSDIDNLPLSPSPSTAPAGGMISVDYTVADRRHSIHDSVTVEISSGQVLFKVLEKARAMYPVRFRFEYAMTFWGESITGIRGIASNRTAHTYWQFLSGSQPIPRGVGSYIPSDGEHITANYTTW